MNHGNDRRRNGLFCLAASILICGCTSQIKTTRVEATALGPSVAAEVKRAEFLGRAIYERDVAAALATDEAFRHGIQPGKTDVVGWITVPAENGWLVRFIAGKDNIYSAVYDVRVPKSGLPTFIELSPRESLPKTQETMFRARQTAVAAAPTNCSDAYNTVVLSDPDSPDGWLVYVLAATKITDEMVVGGHHRVRVSPDGRRVLEDTPLSKSCIRIPPLEPEKKVIAAMTTHLISSTPIETHVFLSLLHRRLIYVSTNLGVWRVIQGRIEYVGPLEKQEK